MIDLSVGDVLELVAAVALTVAAFMYLGFPLALLSVALFLIYEGQCFADIPLRPRDPDYGDRDPNEFRVLSDENAMPRLVHVSQAEAFVNRVLKRKPNANQRPVSSERTRQP